MTMEWLLDQNLADLAAEGMPAVLRSLIGLQPDHQNGIIFYCFIHQIYHYNYHLVVRAF